MNAILKVKLRRTSVESGTSPSGTPRGGGGGAVDRDELQDKISRFQLRAEGGPSSSTEPKPPSISRDRSKKEEATSELARLLKNRREKNGER